MNDGESRREFTRVPVRFRAELHSGETTIPCEETKDISLNGIYLVTARALPLGSECRVVLRLGDAVEGVQVEAQGIIVRKDALGMAVEFGEMGADSYNHLKNLIMYNSAEPEAVEKEIKKLLMMGQTTN